MRGRMNSNLRQQRIIFQAPYLVETITEDLPHPQANQVRVRVLLSAISPGTELLVYRGQFPPGVPLDENISTLVQTANYPFAYGYALVGVVEASASPFLAEWVGQRVFVFAAHQSVLWCDVAQLIPIPNEISDEDAVFFPNMETAINLVQDLQPLIGEEVVVQGLGVVGILTTALLAQFPLGRLIALEPAEQRRNFASVLPLDKLLPPNEFLSGIALERVQLGSAYGVDAVVECSGSPAALQQSIDMAGYAGRVVVGSWYGNKVVTLDLGTRFHRQRIQLISSQVSHISPKLMARWDKKRLQTIVWQQIERIRPAKWITQRFKPDDAKKAYHLLDQNQQDTLQVVFDYQVGGKSNHV